MKHCPNPECPGIENFKTISEFNDIALACSDCGGALVYGPAPDLEERNPEPVAGPEPDVELVPIFILQNQAELLIAQSILDQSGIPYLAKGKGIQDLFGFGQLLPVNPISGPVEIHVRLDDAENARILLAETLEGGSGQ